jgi:hypothetical protein
VDKEMDDDDYIPPTRPEANRKYSMREILAEIVNLGSQDVYTDAPEYVDRVGAMGQWISEGYGLLNEPTTVEGPETREVDDETGLPPDPDDMNPERAEWAEQSLKVFMDSTGVDAGDAICDLLADLMHLCDRESEEYGSFETALSRAQMHYDAETTDEGGGTEG